MLEWNDGIEETPGGMAREIVQPNVWSSSVWITPVGEAFRRYYNPISKAWTWEAMQIAFNPDQTRIGIHLASGWMSSEQAIATAWLHRAPNSREGVVVLDPAEPDVRNLAWGDPDPLPEEGDFEGETWTNLRWMCGQVRCDNRYQISSHGRLRSPYTGKITRGFAARGTRWAACKGAGLVDLMQAAGLIRAEKHVPERVYLAYCAVSSSTPVAEHARRHALSLKTAWMYYALAAPLVHEREVYGKPLVSPDLWRVLTSMRGNPVLGGKLSELHPEVVQRLGGDVSFEELRFARICVVSE